MDQYSGFAAAGSGRNHDAVGLFVGDDLHLSRGERPEELLVFLGRQVALDLVDAFAAEVFCDETPVVHLEIVLHELQRGIVVTDHEVCVFAHNVDLPDLLFVELIQEAIVIYLVFDSIVRDQTLDLHTVIQDKKTALQFECADFRKIKQGIFYIRQRYLLSLKQVWGCLIRIV